MIKNHPVINVHAEVTRIFLFVYAKCNTLRKNCYSTIHYCNTLLTESAKRFTGDVLANATFKNCFKLHFQEEIIILKENWIFTNNIALKTFACISFIFNAARPIKFCLWIKRDAS